MSSSWYIQYPKNYSWNVFIIQCGFMFPPIMTFVCWIEVIDSQLTRNICWWFIFSGCFQYGLIFMTFCYRFENIFCKRIIVNTLMSVLDRADTRTRNYLFSLRQQFKWCLMCQRTFHIAILSFVVGTTILLPLFHCTKRPWMFIMLLLSKTLLH